MSGIFQNDVQDTAEQELKEPPRARVILLNDDYTPMEFVVRLLMDIFRKTNAEAVAIMLAVHEKGRGECGVYSLEIAETKASLVQSRARAAEFPLCCRVELV